MKINIHGLDKAKLLAGLYNNSKIQGMGFFGQLARGSKSGQPMTIEEAREEIANLNQTILKYVDKLYKIT